MVFKKRLQKALAKLKNLKQEALLVSCPVNIFYLTGLSDIEGYLLISHKKTIFFTDFRYQLKCSPECKAAGIDLAVYNFGIFDFIAAGVKKAGLKKIGFEGKLIYYKEFSEFKKSFEKHGLKFAATYDFIKNLRKIKEKQELKLIQKSVNIASEAFDFIRETAYEGLTEKFLALEVERFLKIKADPELAFPPIVASGLSSAQPHYRPGLEKIQINKPFLIDLGAKYRGYCSDLTRVFFLSKMPNYLKKIIDIVKKAKDLSISKIRSGVKAQQIDKTAREFIAKKGYGKFFGHSLGHGVGLQVHELPSINSKNEERLQEGMVITIEPGIYLPGKFGVREESMVLVKKNGAQILERKII
ncbi:MAG: aminopeptidase P family protein [Candidatus Omnitrophica bacterium]|nr:aminopeptidase P family protein [Candidatus Omnitrophota bacterium]